ncbi:MAG: hypothetical protein WD398_01790 [Cyclobacteriaceae bacterium]
MQHQWEFNFETNDFNDTTQGHLEKKIIDLLKNEKQELGIFMSYYFRPDGAIAENVEVPEKVTFHGEWKGSILFKFEKIHFNACLNIHEQDKEKMEIHFNIQSEKEKLVLTGPYWPERGPDEI